MSVYDEIRDNMSTINNVNPNHNYKYYMRVFDSSDVFVRDYLDIEDFCEQNKLVVLEKPNERTPFETPLYNGYLYHDVFDSIKDLFDYDLWDSLYWRCRGEESDYLTDYDEIEARISHGCNIDFSLEEFCRYLKDENDNLDKNDDLDIMLARFILLKKNDVAYCYTEIHGASQGDWMELYYPEGTDEEVIRVLECAIFNLGDEVFICPWNDVDDGGFTYIFVSFPLNRDCLEFAMNETGCKRDEVYIECFDGYEYIPKYRHLEFK